MLLSHLIIERAKEIMDSKMNDMGREVERRAGPIFQCYGLKNVAMLALFFYLQVGFNIFLPIILIVKSMLPNKL